MIRVKMLRLLSLLVIWGNPVATLKQAADIFIKKGSVTESYALFTQYRAQVDSMSPGEIVEHNITIFAEKDDEIQRLKKYLQSIQSKFTEEAYFLITALIEEWEQSTKIIELPSEIGLDLFKILELAHSNPGEALKYFKKFLNPANLERSLIESKTKKPSDLEGFISVFGPIQKALATKFDEAMMDQDFKRNLEDCAEIVRGNPDLLRKFNNMLLYCKRYCTFTQAKPTIHRFI